LIVAVPEVEAVKVLVQVAVPAVVPAANVTDPVGVLTVPAAVSVTVAVQVEPCAITTGLVQLTAVVVVRRLTTTLAAVAVVLVA